MLQQVKVPTASTELLLLRFGNLCRQPDALRRPTATSDSAATMAYRLDLGTELF